MSNHFLQRLHSARAHATRKLVDGAVVPKLRAEKVWSVAANPSGNLMLVEIQCTVLSRGCSVRIGKRDDNERHTRVA